MQKRIDAVIGNLILKQIVNTVDVYYTTAEKDDAKKKTISLSNHNYDFLVVVGGDGTFNEVIGGYVEAKLKIPIALLAAGTVNDFANYLHLPTGTDDIVSMIANFKTVKSDVGRINDHYFINVAAGGMFSDISFAVNKDDKEKLGPLAYYINALVDLPSQLGTDFQLSVTIDEEEELNLAAKLFLITNTQRVAGFDLITPLANIHDGKLDLLIVKECSITDLIALSKDYVLQRHLDSPFLLYRQARKLVLKSDKEILIDIDGEKGDTLPITVEDIEEAVTLLIP